MEISIHTPREGSDFRKLIGRGDDFYFNPHSPRGERPPPASDSPLLSWNFNPHSPRGERRSHRQMQSCPVYFNPHSPRGERQAPGPCKGRLCRFQSTLPARGATWVQGRIIRQEEISIHTPREGSDLSFPPLIETTIFISIHTPREGSDFGISSIARKSSYFNPHSPRGERQLPTGRILRRKSFQSTLPARGATNFYLGIFCAEIISIHTPREGSDRGRSAESSGLSYFNPHSPRGERPHTHFCVHPAHAISLPARGATA